MATLLPTDLPKVRDAIESLILQESAASLADYLRHIVIDTRPPQNWDSLIEPWQEEIVAPLIPAIEFAAGLRKEYTGPQSFFYVLPKGHDKTGVISRVANWAVGFAKESFKGIAAASTKEQAGFLLDSMKDELRLNPWLQSRVTPFRDKMLGENGWIRVISSDVKHSSGLKADLLILDELTFWDNDSLWNGLILAREKRPWCIMVVITNAGLLDSWQWKLLQDCKADKANWHVYESPPKKQLASWMNEERIAKNREKAGAGFARRVVDNEWIPATETPLLPFDLLKSCFDTAFGDSQLWPDGEVPRGCRPLLYIGADIGFSNDRAVIWTFELVGDVAVTREVFVMTPTAGKPIDPDDLGGELVKRIGSRYCMGARIDEGAVGYVIARNLEKRFPHLVEGVTLGAPIQGKLALAMKTAFEGKRIRIPDNVIRADVTADFKLIDQIETANGSPKLKTNRGDTGHGDRFWAAALGLYAMPITQPKPSAPPLARKSKLRI